MFLFGNAEAKGALAIWQALNRSQAIIEFKPDGTILSANALFLDLMGYGLDEVVGRHHAMFVDKADAAAPAYRQFWAELARGEFRASEFRRITKAGSPVYIQASYNPIVEDGRVTRVVKIASDVTASKNVAADFRSQMQAISRAQAVIEFSLDGTVLTANDNFLGAMGYALPEIRGKHHRIFVDPSFAHSREYEQFWKDLGSGKALPGREYRRIGKGGRDVWIQASYNPIFDADGRPYKVVKYATDITARKQGVLRIGEALEQLAEGRLDCQISQTLPDELNDVRDTLNATVDRLRDIMSGLRASATSLRSATSEILSGTMDLSERSRRQAAAVAETGAVMGQLADSVAENSRRADVAHAAAIEVSSTAEAAGTAIGSANSAMERISASSAKISNIIGLIDDIAFQTNLLALNASVEAARAGEAGKGFAVVAIEVRRLAQSAAQASSEVKQLIDQSGNEVDAGSRLVAEATDKVVRVVEGILRSSELVEQISEATRKQAESIADVSAAVRQMGEMTQQNAALVQQTNAAVEQTEGQASELDLVVEQFVFDRAMRVRAAA